MDKKVLRTVISSFQPGQEVSVTFRGEQSGLSGTFRVLSRKTGRGKGGSLLAELQSLTDNTTVTIGTPSNENVLNIGVAGVVHGSANEADEPRNYPTSEARHLALKEQMRPLLGEAGIGRQVRITSTVDSSLNGTFRVLPQLVDVKNPAKGNVGARLERGRYGQIRLQLASESGATLEVWTYRHSTAIDTFEIIELAPTA